MEARGQLGVDSLLPAMWDSRIELRSSPGLVAGTFTCWAMLLVSVRVYVKQTWGKKGEDLCGYCWLQISLYLAFSPGHLNAYILEQYHVQIPLTVFLHLHGRSEQLRNTALVTSA